VQQASQGAGHIAQLESSGTSWKLPFLGAGGSLEETDIRLPPLSPGACFKDEYEVQITFHCLLQLLFSGGRGSTGNESIGLPLRFPGAAQYNPWILTKLMLKRVMFSCFLSIHQPQDNHGCAWLNKLNYPLPTPGLGTMVSVCRCVQLMLIIDSREKYSNTGKDRADGLAAKIQVIRDRGISVDVRMLEQGDVLWIAHSRYL